MRGAFRSTARNCTEVHETEEDAGEMYQIAVAHRELDEQAQNDGDEGDVVEDEHASDEDEEAEEAVDSVPRSSVSLELSGS